MNQQVEVKAGSTWPALVKTDPTTPALKVTEAGGVAVKAGTNFGGETFIVDEPVLAPVEGYKAGVDYVATVADGAAAAFRADAVPSAYSQLGGFHFAPGECATARSGGNETPAINPHSLWDRNFRPACADPRGMTFVKHAAGNFWADIYLLGVNHHVDGTSKYNVMIADGRDCPINPADGTPFKKLDYETSVAVMAHHGKQLLSYSEFIALAHGVTERTVHDGDPVSTKWDAPRVSQRGGNQMSGNLWVWGHDGDPDTPRASVFGGSWWDDDDAGSRHADVACNWPGSSNENLGARGRSDHLQLG
jgi:hypothetical protein